jgi:flagellar secretion chaperone FliS
MTHPALTYRQLSVQGATPIGLIVMLYDGAISALQRANAAIEARDIEKKCAHLNRVLAIVAQLEGTLDFDRGGEVAQTLQQLYVHARARILQANIENSKEILTSLAQQFSTVREAWDQIDRPSAPPAAAPQSRRSDRDPFQPSDSPSLRLTA